jgi:hypothetical protein
MRFAARKINAQLKCGRDRNKSASPNSTKITPDIIGFRT